MHKSILVLHLGWNGVSIKPPGHPFRVSLSHSQTGRCVSEEVVESKTSHEAALECDLDLGFIYRQPYGNRNDSDYAIHRSVSCLVSHIAWQDT